VLLESYVGSKLCRKHLRKEEAEGEEEECRACARSIAGGSLSDSPRAQHKCKNRKVCAGVVFSTGEPCSTLESYVGSKLCVSHLRRQKEEGKEEREETEEMRLREMKQRKLKRDRREREKEEKKKKEKEEEGKEEEKEDHNKESSQATDRALRSSLQKILASQQATITALTSTNASQAFTIAALLGSSSPEVVDLTSLGAGGEEPRPALPQKRGALAHVSDERAAGAAAFKKVKLEKAAVAEGLEAAKTEKAAVAEELEDAEQLQKCLQLSEDTKMSEIDALKGKVKRLEEENEALRRGG